MGEKTARKRGKRRSRTQHPGVKIRRRTYSSGTTTWFARWKDPDTGVEVDTNLTTLGLTNADARRNWAICKSEVLAARKAHLATGAPRRTETQLEDAIHMYLEDCRARLRPSTIRAYSNAIERFNIWARGAGLKIVEDLGPELLANLRWDLLSERKRQPVKGSRRGTPWKEGSRRRSPCTANTLFRCIKTMLTYWRRSGLLPRLDSDAIADGLKSLPQPKPRPKFLKPEQVRRLLEAALRHDDETFKITRAEHDGELPIGSTPRHPSIAPFLYFVLASGCRLGEALTLRWSALDLQALDEFGKPTGEIVLDVDTKTHHARAIDLSVSPALRAILGALSLRRGPGRYVFGGDEPQTSDLVNSARRRLMRSYGAPEFNWQLLRSTCDTYLVNAPGIFGGAAVYRAARQLGHSVLVAERHYQGLVRGIPREARTLEAAMQVEDLTAEIVRRTAEAPAGGVVGGSC